MYVYLIVTYYEPVHYKVFSNESDAVTFAKSAVMADAVLRVKVDAADDDEDGYMTVWERVPAPAS